MDSPYIQILNSVRTKSELDQLEQKIEKILKDIFLHRSGSFDQALPDETQFQLLPSLRLYLSEESDELKYEKAQFFLSELKKELKKLRVLKLTLAFDPDEDFTAEVFEWVSTNITKGIIVEFHKDDSICAGTLIEFEGVYKDYSLSRVIDQVFALNKAKILGIQ